MKSYLIDWDRFWHSPAGPNLVGGVHQAPSYWLYRQWAKRKGLELTITLVMGYDLKVSMMTPNGFWLRHKGINRRGLPLLGKRAAEVAMRRAAATPGTSYSGGKSIIVPLHYSDPGKREDLDWWFK